MSTNVVTNEEKYRALNDKTQTLVSAWINGKDTSTTTSVSALWSQKCLDLNDTVTSVKNYYCNDSQHVYSTPSSPWTSYGTKFPSNLVATHLPTGRTATWKPCNPTEASPSSHPLLLVYEDSSIAKYVLQPPAELHGKVLSGSRVSALEFNSDGTKLAYVAEIPDDKSKNVMNSSAFDYKTDYGEAYTGHYQALVVIVDLQSSSFKVISDENLSLTSVIWCCESDSMICVGYDISKNDEGTLGLAYCFNRSSALYLIDDTTTNTSSSMLRRLTHSEKGDASVRSPRVSGKKLVYLSSDKNVVTHNTCSRIVMLSDWSSLSPDRKILVDVVEDIRSGTDFAGVYAADLPRKCFVTPNVLCFNTVFRSRLVYKAIDIESGEFVKTSNDDSKMMSQTVLDTSSSQVLISRSSPTQPVELVLCDFRTVKEVVLESQAPSKAIDRALLYEIDPSVPLTVAGSVVERNNNTSSSTATYDAILLLPNDTTSSFPVVLDIHGGPHGVTSTSYKLSNDYLASLGYAVLIVNYRGSIGFGNKALNSLVGNAGYQDVDDVQRALEVVLLKSSSLLNKNRVYATGGSHGGFITCHLVAKYGECYAAGVVRNPVTNLVTQFFTSDIPEWGTTMAGITSKDVYFLFKNLHLNEGTDGLQPQCADLYKSVATMLAHSPMGNLKEKTVFPPMLFGLGELDRRVPATEGLQFYKMLRGKGVEAKVRWYPKDNHSLSSVAATSDFMVAMAAWLEEH